MRLSEEIAEFLKTEITATAPEAKVYLFGSRADDSKRGGDIDILILTREKLNFRQLNSIRINFWKQFGEQKIDLVNFTFEEEEPFKNIALSEAVKL